MIIKLLYIDTITKNNTDAKSFRNVVFIIGTLLALFFILAFVHKIIINSSDKVHTPNPGREWEGQAMLAMFITYLVGYALGWLWRLWGGNNNHYCFFSSICTIYIIR